MIRNPILTSIYFRSGSYIKSKPENVDLMESQFPKPDTRLPTTRLQYDYVSREPFPDRNYTMDAVLCFMIPLIIGATLVSSLTCIFFYNKEKAIKKCNETPIQIEQYNSISRATLNLRSLAHNRHLTPSHYQYDTLQSWSASLPRPILKQKSRPPLPEAWRTGSL